LIEDLEPKVHNLYVCYRQSANVGITALQFTNQVLEKTSPFIVDSKVDAHKKLLDPLREICVEKVEFVDTGGRFRLYENEVMEAFQNEFNRFSRRIDRWKHWHPLLIVEDKEGFPFPEDWKQKVRGLNVITKSTEQVDQIRGCEFQEVFLFIGSRTWKILTKGILGATNNEWSKALSFHTLMTRPKDSLVIFVQ
jgi:hypothetical protein